MLPLQADFRRIVARWGAWTHPCEAGQAREQLEAAQTELERLRAERDELQSK